MSSRYILGVILLVFFSFSCGTNKKMAESHPSFSGDKRNVGEIQPADSTANTAINTENSDSVLVSEYSQADYHSSYDIIFDLIHTKLAVRFDWEKQHLMGKAEIDLKAHFYPQNVLVLDAKGFDVNSVALLDGKKSSLLQFKYDQKKLTIELGRFYTRDQRLKIAIDYVAKPNELPKPENVGSAITDDKGLYFINPLGDKEEPQQIWTQGETESASCWF
ncbi:MAG: hypothetical protein RIS47_2250, partial [Bacteroidota bacterium]